MAAPKKPAAEKPVATPRQPTELGWLPDCVYTGEKFETGLAFFADAQGRIARFSREPRDLEIARRLAGQAVLPGLVNTHSISWQRVLRGRVEAAAKPGGAVAAWRELRAQVLAKMSPDDAFEAARMAFTEMLLAGVTCVGEVHELRRAVTDGSPASNDVALQILRAAHEVGIRLALFSGVSLRGGHAGAADQAVPRLRAESVDAFVRETEALRAAMAGTVSDEAWLGVAPDSVATVPLDAFKAIAGYAHAQRMRVQTLVARERAEVAACVAEYGRTPLAALADTGIVDKRFTAVHGAHLSEDECRLLGTARASLCGCPLTEQSFSFGLAPAAAVLAAGGGFALGTGGHVQIDLMEEARALEYASRAGDAKKPALGPDAAKVLFHAATVAGARSLGATGGALEVGRPADFFTVNLYDPSLAGADADTLLATIVFGLERRAIRDVWIGARQRIANGRHLNQGLIVGRFVESQRRLWPTK